MHRAAHRSSEETGLKTTRGLLTELRVQAKLAEMANDLYLFTPSGPDTPVDLIAYWHGQLSRIQIKTMRYGRWHGKLNDTLTMSFSSVVDGVGGKIQKVLTPADCDVVVGFHPDTVRFYVAAPTGRQGISLRLTASLNNNTRRVNLASSRVGRCASSSASSLPAWDSTCVFATPVSSVAAASVSGWPKPVNSGRPASVSATKRGVRTQRLR